VKIIYVIECEECGATFTEEPAAVDLDPVDPFTQAELEAMAHGWVVKHLNIIAPKALCPECRELSTQRDGQGATKRRNLIKDTAYGKRTQGHSSSEPTGKKSAPPQPQSPDGAP